MPRPPRKPDNRKTFRIQVVLAGALVADIDAAASKIGEAEGGGVTRTDVVRRAIAEWIKAFKEREARGV